MSIVRRAPMHRCSSTRHVVHMQNTLTLFAVGLIRGNAVRVTAPNRHRPQPGSRRRTMSVFRPSTSTSPHNMGALVPQQPEGLETLHTRSRRHSTSRKTELSWSCARRDRMACTQVVHALSPARFAPEGSNTGWPGWPARRLSM